MSTFQYRKELGVEVLTRPLDKDRTALVLIDMIKGDTRRDVGLGSVVKNDYFFGRIEEKVVPNLKRLLAFFREKNLTIVHVRVASYRDDNSDWPARYRQRMLTRKLMPCRPGLEGYEWLEGFEPLPTEVVLQKHSVSAFNGSVIDNVLRNLGITDIVIGGVATPYGVGHAAIDAGDRGYWVVIPEDGTAAYSQETHDSWLKMNAEFYFRVLSTPEIISELS